MILAAKALRVRASQRCWQPSVQVESAIPLLMSFPHASARGSLVR